jgi:hypothetical protein
LASLTNQTTQFSPLPVCSSLAQLESSDAPKIENGLVAMRCNRCHPVPNACRQALWEQADSILESVSALVGLDRRDLDAAWQPAHRALKVPLTRLGTSNNKSA